MCDRFDRVRVVRILANDVANPSNINLGPNPKTNKLRLHIKNKITLLIKIISTSTKIREIIRIKKIRRNKNKIEIKLTSN